MVNAVIFICTFNSGQNYPFKTAGILTACPAEKFIQLKKQSSMFKSGFTLFLTALTLLITGHPAIAQKNDPAPKKSEPIRWISFEEAMKLNKKKPKMVFIDIYTDWCGWCKKMDAETFSDPEIAAYINKRFYAVKFNAEQKEAVIFKEQEFINPNPEKSRSTHKLALALLKNEKLYPSYVILDKSSDWTFKLKGYLAAGDLLPVLKFYGEEHYKKMSWGEYSQSKPK